jgi:hypothetical protein
MEYLAQLADWSELAFAALLFGVLLLAHEAGALVSRRAVGREEKAPEGVGVVVGGLLALLAFVLALTLSYASGRFSERRAGALAEANAISTAWTRAQAIAHPRGKEIAGLLAARRSPAAWRNTPRFGWRSSRPDATRRASTSSTRRPMPCRQR